MHYVHACTHLCFNVSNHITFDNAHAFIYAYDTPRANIHTCIHEGMHASMHDDVHAIMHGFRDE